MIPKELCYSLDNNITRKQLSEQYSSEYCNKFSEKELSFLEQYIQKNHIHILLKENKNDTYIFDKIPQAPHILYYIGNKDLLQLPSLGIVGPRNPSIYATHIIKKICSEFSGYNIVTVSGGADGIDTICHTESIGHNIPTICILGGGLDYYLQHHTMIGKIIGGGGLVISEFKLFSKPERYTFPMRNRIIAGLSDKLIIPEAGIKSGSLITADYMNKLHKPIFGIVGNILEEKNIGLHTYLYDKRISPIYSISQFCKDNYKQSYNKSLYFNKIIYEKKDTSNVSIIGKKILDYSYQGSIYFEELLGKLDISSQSLLSELSILELDNYINYKQNIIYFI